MRKYTEKDYKVFLLNQFIKEMLDNRIKTSDGLSGVSIKIPNGFDKTPKEVIKIMQKFKIIQEYSNTNYINMFDNGKGSLNIFLRRSFGNRKPFGLNKFFQMYIETLKQIEEGKTV